MRQSKAENHGINLCSCHEEEDPERRKRIYEEANRIVADSYQVLPLYQASVLVVTRQDIEGVKINSQGIFGFEYLVRKN